MINKNTTRERSPTPHYSENKQEEPDEQSQPSQPQPPQPQSESQPGVPQRNTVTVQLEDGTTEEWYPRTIGEYYAGLIASMNDIVPEDKRDKFCLIFGQQILTTHDTYEEAKHAQDVEFMHVHTTMYQPSWFVSTLDVTVTTQQGGPAHPDGAVEPDVASQSG